MERKRKADDTWDDKQNSKKSRLEYFDEDLFLQLPNEILQLLLQYGDPIALSILSLTSKHWNQILSAILTNKRWYEIYLAARKRFKMNIDGTVLEQVLKSARGWMNPDHEAVFEWDFEVWDHPVTSDCAKVQQELLADEELISNKFPLKYFFDESSYTCHIGVKENLKNKTYDETVDYKRLAMKFEQKYHQFELWRDSKPTTDAFHNLECSCLKEENDLALYDGNDEEIKELQSELDIKVTQEGYFSVEISGPKEFEHGWDESSSCEDAESASDSEEDDIESPPKEHSGEHEEVIREKQSDVQMANEGTPEDSSDESSEHEYDGLISVERRDKFFEYVAHSDHSLKLFIQVLSAIVLGQCPPPICSDSVLINTAKFEHSMVRTGDVIDEVMNQIKHASTLAQSPCISTMICALQKLRMSDLLFLKQGAEEKYPYLSAIYSVFEVEESIPLAMYIADRCETFKFEQSVVPWSGYFQADIATDDDFETMPDWLSIRHSMHRLMRKSGIMCATPNTTEFAVHKLCEYIHNILAAVEIEKLTENSNSVDVRVDDILKAMEKQPNEEFRSTLYPPYCSGLFDENPILMNSDSEDYSDHSSVDSDWVDEPITDLDDNNVNVSEEIDVVNDDPLHSIVQESLKKCVKHAQYDAKEDPPEDENLERLEGDAIMEDKSDVTDNDETEEIISQHLDSYWETVVEAASGNDDKVAYYMPKTLVEEAVYYTGQTLEEDDAMAQLFIQKYEDDIPLHDIPNEQRNEMLTLRRQTNQMIKEQCEEECHHFVNTKYARMRNNYQMFDPSIRSDANECKTMVIDLRENRKLDATIQSASNVIRSSSVLKSIKLVNLNHTPNDDHEAALIAQLMNGIASCSSIESLVISNCYFKSYAPLSQLLHTKQLKKFHLMFPMPGDIECEDEFLAALESQATIKDLWLPIMSDTFKQDERREKYLKTVASLLPQLEVLHVWYTGIESTSWDGVKGADLAKFSYFEELLKLRQPHKLVVNLPHRPFVLTPSKLLDRLKVLNVDFDIIRH